MFSLLILLFGCKDNGLEQWDTCPEEISYSGSEGSGFGFRLLPHNDTLDYSAIRLLYPSL